MSYLLGQANRLYPDEQLWSPNGAFELKFQTDGNIVLYQQPEGTVLWSSDTSNQATPGELLLQADGNLVAYDTLGQAFWSTDTCNKGSPPYSFRTQDDGNCVLFGPTDNPIWQTNSCGVPPNDGRPDSLFAPGQDRLDPDGQLWSQNRSYQFRFQSDANMAVLKQPGDEVIWTSETGLKAQPKELVLQEDGNLVAYDVDGNPFWASNTEGKGHPPYRFILRNDGNLVIYAANGNPIWTNSIGENAIIRTSWRVERDLLRQHAQLFPDQSLWSPNGVYQFVLRGDGDIVLLKHPWQHVLWSSGTAGVAPPKDLVVQADGNLVAYDAYGNPFWASNTCQTGAPPYHLVLQNDGNCVLYSSGTHAIWSTDTCGR